MSYGRTFGRGCVVDIGEGEVKEHTTRGRTMLVNLDRRIFGREFLFEHRGRNRIRRCVPQASNDCGLDRVRTGPHAETCQRNADRA